MGTCPYCGTPYPEGATYCGSCGQPLTGALPRGAAKPDRTLKSIVWIAAGGGCLLLLIAIAGIVAAIVIPNFVDAKNKAQQKRTVADVRTIATALESARSDDDHYPAVTDAAALGTALAGHGYKGNGKDGWDHPLRYTCLQKEDGGCTSYELASGGRDGAFEHAPGEYPQDPFEPTAYDSDIVMSDGMFSRWPSGQGRSLDAGGG
jgi:type II secretory pathway pseudopilin PulG